ncbi:MAG TPA: hypothetical protein VM262_09575, partial [Acidimicrobiales bacterium]|nr:hypothetical protein [Acidimicrobiales bacterium]
MYLAWTAQAEPSNPRNWTGLTFPAARPAHRAVAEGVSFSASPLAADAMWNVRQSTPPSDLLAAVTAELLQSCAYYGNEETVVATTVATVASLNAAQR